MASNSIVVEILKLTDISLCVGVYPLWEGRKSMAHTFKSIYLDILGRGGPSIQGRVVDEPEESEKSTSGKAAKDKQ